MSQRREIELRLTLYDELSGILGAMRSFALAELHRVNRREIAQTQAIAALEAILRDVSRFLPQQPRATQDIWLLFGSVRGFCSSFNEDVMREWVAAEAQAAPTIVVGERLAAAMPVAPHLYTVPGAESAPEAVTGMDEILQALRQAQQVAGEHAGLIACVRDEQAARTVRLLPWPRPQAGSGVPPIMNEPATKVASAVAEHYLFHSLLALQLGAIRVENRMRLMQMENALQHLERGTGELQQLKNKIRQETIVEEIELMARDRHGLH